MKNIISAAYAASKLAEIGDTLASSMDPDIVKGLHDQIVELLDCIRASGLNRDLLRQANELKLRIERKVGDILPTLHLPGGDHISARAAEKLTLKRLGLTRKHSAAWQLESQLPEEDVALYFRQAASQNRMPSSHGLCGLAAIHVEKMKHAENDGSLLTSVADGLQSLGRQGKRFARICVNFGGPVSNEWVIGFHLDRRLVQLPLMEVAAPQSHLYLRATPQSREGAAKLLRAWGYSLKALLACTETVRDARSPVQRVCDLWLLGVRDGSEDNLHGLAPWIDGAFVLTANSAQAVYHFIEEASPPPYLDVFGSRPFSKGWTIVTT